MLRRALISATVIATTVLAGVSLSSAAPAPTSLVAFQDQDATPAAPAAQLLLGQRFATDVWELEIQDAFVTESSDRAAYIEVRASVAFRSLGEEPLPYEWAGFTGMTGYPTLQVVDREGVVYPIDVFEPDHTMVPGSHLVSLEPFVPAHWTLGFEANGPQSDQLTVQAVWEGVVVAEWDVYSTPQPLAGWNPPPGAEVLGDRARFDWGDQLSLTMVDHGTEACGDPAIGPLFTAFAAQISVENIDIRPGLFPNVLHPEPTAIAIWTDGSSAHSTTTIDAAIAGLDPGDVVINTRSHEQVIVPAATTVNGFFTFALARDGRFADVNESPAAIVLYPSDGPAQWWTVQGPGGVTFFDICTDTEGGSAFEATRP